MLAFANSKLQHRQTGIGKHSRKKDESRERQRSFLPSGCNLNVSANKKDDRAVVFFCYILILIGINGFSNLPTVPEKPPILHQTVSFPVCERPIRTSVPFWK